MPPAAIVATQVASITTALLAAGSNLSLSIFDVPEFQALPASQSLPQIRWLFSRGSHIFPQAAMLSSAGFLYLAYNALPVSQRGLLQLAKVSLNSTQVTGNLLAAALVFSIGPFTRIAMIPTNFALIKFNEEKGGFRSANSARENASTSKAGSRSAEDSVLSKDETSQFTDLSGPQSKTTRDSIPEEDRKARELLGRFGQLNLVRGFALVAGGMVGLVVALTP